MAFIETDDPLIEKELQKLEDLISEGGGGIHSNVVLTSHDGGLGVKTKEPMARGKEIIRLPREALLPADKYNLGAQGDEFTLEFPAGSNFTTLQRKLAESMITLYNFTHKVKSHKQTSFLYVYASYPDVLDKISAARSFGGDMMVWREKIAQGLKDEELSEYLGESFLKTRNLGYTDYVRVSSVPVLMPVIDFMNHHWNGANFNVGQGVRKGDLAIAAAQETGSLDCFAFYNIMDPLDAFIRYDFIDEASPVIRSVPIDLEVEDFGIIRVGSGAGSAANKKLPTGMADLKRFLPTFSLEKDQKILKVSHLLIPIDGSPLALRRVLHMLLVNLAQKNLERSFFGPRVRELEAQIIEKNKAFYKDFLVYLDGVIQEKGSNPALQRLRHVYEVQARNIELYTLMKGGASDVAFGATDQQLVNIDDMRDMIQEEPGA